MEDLLTMELPGDRRDYALKFLRRQGSREGLARNDVGGLERISFETRWLLCKLPPEGPWPAAGNYVKEPTTAPVTRAGARWAFPRCLNFFFARLHFSDFGSH